METIQPMQTSKKVNNYYSFVLQFRWQNKRLSRQKLLSHSVIFLPSKLKNGIFSQYLARNSIFIDIWYVCDLLFFDCILFYRWKLQKEAKSIMMIHRLFKNHRKNHKKHWLSCHSNSLRHWDVGNLHIRSFHPQRTANLSNRRSSLRCSNIC